MKTIVVTDAMWTHVCEQFGAKLKEAREGIGMTQAEFAEDIGYRSPTSISRWEKGLGMPRTRTLWHLAKWMGLSLDYLYGFSRERHHEQHRARARAS
jgi:repressor LexA